MPYQAIRRSIRKPPQTMPRVSRNMDVDNLPWGSKKDLSLAVSRRRETNARLHAVYLPTEILEEIFVLVCSAWAEDRVWPRYCGHREARNAIMRTCFLWQQVATTASRLWARIYLHEDQLEGAMTLTQLEIKRAGSRSVDLFIICSGAVSRHLNTFGDRFLSPPHRLLNCCGAAQLPLLTPNLRSLVVAGTLCSPSDDVSFAPISTQLTVLKLKDTAVAQAKSILRSLQSWVNLASVQWYEQSPPWPGDTVPDWEDIIFERPYTHLTELDVRGHAPINFVNEASFPALRTLRLGVEKNRPAIPNPALVKKVPLLRQLSLSGFLDYDESVLKDEFLHAISTHLLIEDLHLSETLGGEWAERLSGEPQANQTTLFPSLKRLWVQPQETASEHPDFFYAWHLLNARKHQEETWPTFMLYMYRVFDTDKDRDVSSKMVDHLEDHFRGHFELDTPMAYSAPHAWFNY
ncbi:hypothetical protein DL93DRAFT_2090004 [Clavulina sp. PMI_390]|nr:hypothetical protein DL93DRAFT_2090004 [Clavulina sp. PMI_390]